MTAPVGRLPKIAEFLLKAKVIDEFQMRSALAQQAQWGHRLTRILNDMRLAPEAKVVGAIAEQTKLAPIDLAALPEDPAALRKLDADYCTQKGVFPCALRDQGKTLMLAMCDPTDFVTTTDVEKKTRCRLKLFVVGEAALTAAVKKAYLGGQEAYEDHAVEAVGIEFEHGNTGEFMNHQGGVVAKMRPNSDAARPAPVVPELRAPSPAAPPPPPEHVPFQTPNADALDSLFDFVPEALTPEEKQRLEAVKQNQERGNLILRAILELCVEKGLMTAADVNRLRL